MNKQTPPKVLFVSGINDSGEVKVNTIAPNGITLNYQVEGSCSVFNSLESADFQKLRLFLDTTLSQQFESRFMRVSLIFNQIANEETHKISLQKLTKLQEMTGLICINEPQSVLINTREHVALVLADLAGLIVPKVARISFKNPDQLAAAVNDSGIAFPMIIRPVGIHYNKDMILLQNREALNQVPLAFCDGRDYHIIEFFDICSEQGLYEKIRLIVIDGEVYIKHLYFSDVWCTGEETREIMNVRPELWARGQGVLDSFETAIKPKISERIREIAMRLGLDVFGIDCYIYPDGRILLFEANACMNILIPEKGHADGSSRQLELIERALLRLIKERL
ncbi:hypothetical protein PQO03_14930 [Lentisphaera profundi]|uniref:ATP-grasp domain-containing protein n=1 Tax=Lentisphaera profundi TaxID=1658616 RepID=A0ABY7W0Y1_9BACT|nr:hypothetical protein [Lentisphaera profundi]WDE99128.1 hypothetical protein PQO03_14930 [Lentisphaera profundi]